MIRLSPLEPRPARARRAPLRLHVAVGLMFSWALVQGVAGTPATRTLDTESRDREPVVTLSQLQRLVDDFRDDLGIAGEISVSIVPKNSFVVSVEKSEDPSRFVMRFERGFVNVLEEDELGAVVAHELGHVWIFTHHPYLHTERLANQIAMRLVTRDSLARVYDKLREHGGTKGDFADFLPDEETPTVRPVDIRLR